MRVIKVTVHHDPSFDEWALRLNAKNGATYSIGTLKGKEAAEVVRDVLQGALELYASVEAYSVEPDRKLSSFSAGMKNANQMVEGERLTRFLEES